MKLAALLLATLWLPAVLHCQLEAAEVHFLTHGDHDDYADDHHADGEHHALSDSPIAVATSSLKVLPPPDSLSLVLIELATLGSEHAEQRLSCPCHGPPPEWQVAWQFITRAAPPARAPGLVNA